MSLQRVGKENKIGFMEMDYDKLAKEVRDIDNKYNNREKVEQPIAKPTSGNLYRQQSHNMMAFLDGNSVPQPAEQKQPEIKAEAARKFTRPDVIMGSSNQILPSRGGEDRDGAAPQKQIKSETSNSIWENRKLIDMVEAAEKTSKERVAEQKQQQAERKQTMRQEANDRLVEQIQSVDQRKASNISKIHESSEQPQEPSYKQPTRNMSIFDSADFERLAEKTDGERISEAKRNAQKDESWKLNQKQHTTKDVLNRLFDALSGE